MLAAVQLMLAVVAAVAAVMSPAYQAIIAAAPACSARDCEQCPLLTATRRSRPSAVTAQPSPCYPAILPSWFLPSLQVLHPEGAVRSLRDAMQPCYDDYYAGLAPFAFKRCLPYQDADNEVSPFRGRMPPAAPASQPPADGDEGGHLISRNGSAVPAPQGRGVVEQYSQPLPALYGRIQDLYGLSVAAGGSSADGHRRREAYRLA